MDICNQEQIIQIRKNEKILSITFNLYCSVSAYDYCYIFTKSVGALNLGITLSTITMLHDLFIVTLLAINLFNELITPER